MKNHDFQELVDLNLSGLVWDERKRQKTLRAVSEEEKPVRRISRTFILAAVIVCLSVTAALAVGLTFSKKVDNAKLAEEALLREYGVTSEMHTFFNRSDGEEEGFPAVYYEGAEPFAYVLGRYTVLIKNGRADAFWSWDGEDVSDGFHGEAWGAEQLSEMIRISQDDQLFLPLVQIAENIARAHGAYAAGQPAVNGVGIETYLQKLRSDAEKAENAARLSIPEMEEIAREALAVRYNFTAEQAENLICVEENGCYSLFGSEETPCYDFWFYLGSEDGGQGLGSGVYTATINVENGTVEDTLYDSALAGKG